MSSKYRLIDVPTSGTYTYKGKTYPKWDIDGLPVSNNQLWNAMGLGDHTFNPDTDPEGKVIESELVVWTDESAPIDEICTIASQQGGSGTPDEIIETTEKRAKNFLGLVGALKAWHTGTDGYDGATGGLWDWLGRDMVPEATEDDWMDLLCERVDQYIGSRYDINPPADMAKLLDGDTTEAKRLDVWARKRAQEIYDGCRVINEEIKKEKAEKVERARREAAKKADDLLRAEAEVGAKLFCLYETCKGVRGYHYTLDCKENASDLLEFGPSTKFVKAYKLAKDDYESYYTEIPVCEAVYMAERIEQYFIAKEV